VNGRFDKRALAGCIVMVGLALAAVVLHIESIDIWPFHHDDMSMTDYTQNAPPASDVPPVAALDDTSDADIAYVLQAISDNLQRNDLTAAKVLLDEVLAVHKDLPQALALQQELRARELKADRADRAMATATVETTGSARISNASGSHNHERTVAHRPLTSTGRHHVDSREPGNIAQRNHPVTVSNGRPKTRAEVVAELKRARANGTMPNFGGRHP
jgi:hypothetical protein